MACGEAVETTEGYLGLCRGTMSYPCGIEWCSTSVQIPYPCGIKMCRGWFGIRYPCGIKWCWASVPISYPCGVKWCQFGFYYLCIKRRPTTKYCYDFTSVGFTCYFLYEKIYGCCGGKQYSWSSPCFFVNLSGPGSVSGYTRNVRKCFDEPLKPTGDCKRGESIPPVGDVPGQPLDEGSVAPHPTTTGLHELRRRDDRPPGQSKLGYCRPCAIANALICIGAWSLYLLSSSADLALAAWLCLSLLGLAGVSTLMAAGHAVAYVYRQARADRRGSRGCDCGQSDALQTGHQVQR